MIYTHLGSHMNSKEHWDSLVAVCACERGNMGPKEHKNLLVVLLESLGKYRLYRAMLIVRVKEIVCLMFREASVEAPECFILSC